MKKLTLAFAAILAASCATAASAAMYTDFESYKSFEAGGNPVYAFDDAADYWVGEWSGGGTTADTVTAEIAEGAGFNGSKALKVQSTGHENVGLYLFATADNAIATDHTGAAYLRVWADFSEIDFRKANFGTTDSTYSLFTTDEVDGAWECKYYYSADGAAWEEYAHGDDGCFGTGQAGTVYGMKGWFAFPVADFTIRSNANWEAYDDKTPANPADVSGVYLFWDYDDATAAETPFYLDNLEFVADYKVFDYDAGAAAATTEAPAASAGLPAAYPVSGTAIPDGSVLIAGELIGSENGWDGTAGSGRAAAFDGNIDTFFDPATASVDYCGIDAGEEMILTKIMIHPRTTYLDRFNGATIEASNDPEFNESVELYFSVEQAPEIAFVDCTADMEASENTGYRYFRYINYMSHGDVAEVELYGYAKDGSNPVYGAAAAPVEEAPAAEAAPAGENIEFAHYVASANDPYFAYDNTIDIDTSVVTWAQIKYRTITEKDSLDNTLTGQIYVSPAAEPFIPVKWNHTGNWETIVVDLTSVSESTTLASLWKDSLGLGFRLDPMESNRDAEANTGNDAAAVLPDSAIDVAYVAFFETEEAAKAFDGVNGAVALIDAAMLAAPSAATNGAVELLSEAVAAPVVEEEPVVEETPVEEPAAEEVVEAPAEEAPAEEAPAEEPAEEVVEAVEEAPAAEEVVEEAPQTFDFAVIAAVAAVIAAAGFAISKKR